jgi:hypothetical protein
MEQLKEAKAYALSDSDLKQLTGRTNVFTYPTLNNVRNIDEVLKHEKGGIGHAIILYLTDDEKTGHWIAIIKRGNTIELFDPYGNSPSTLNKDLKGGFQTEQRGTLLEDLVRRSGYKLIHNSSKVQPVSPDIQTCGRHTAARVMFSHLSLPDYLRTIKSLAKEGGVTVDTFVTALTEKFMGGKVRGLSD